ncbi:uncharacterized protein LOC143527935 isoform X3 [Brachyhypopomus gauderio]|uniref:uncharacterized protein LOC143527935 isoform X3 n=1 Tax=Brachyhypopomus gauderio TaxID=698409 RepID=UPI0040432396
MKKIQPFTIGTKLSVPNGAQCLDFVDIILPARALDGSKLTVNRNARKSLSHGRTQFINPNAPALEDGSEDECISESPVASSRSIRKIAVCGNAETEGDCAGINLCSGTCEPNQSPNSAETYTERKFVDKSLPCLETEPWKKRKMKNLQYDYGFPTFPFECTGNIPASLKGFDNSQHLAACPDLKNEAERVAVKKSSTVGECIDKSWLKFRSIFQDQQDLVLALDVSAFYQQADIIINTINSKRSSVQVTDVQSLDRKEKEIRRISGQIKMLNESAAWLSSLHPTLASRVAHKQAEVQQSWAGLQDAAGNQRAYVFSRPYDRLGKADCDAHTAVARSTAKPEFHGVMEEHVTVEENRLCESEDPWVCRMSVSNEHSSGLQTSPVSPSGSSCYRQSNVTETCSVDPEREQLLLLDSVTTQQPFRLHEVLTEFSTAADRASLLETSICVPSGEEGGGSEHSQEHRSAENEVFQDQMEGLWEGQRKRYELGIEADPEDKELHLTDEVAQTFLELPHANHSPKNVGENHSGMLETFLESLDHKDSPALQNDSGVSECNEAFPGVTGDLRVCSHDQGQSNQELLNLQLSTLTLRMNEHLSHCAELSMDILDMEEHMSIFCDLERCGVGRLQEQQDGLEVDYHLIERAMEAMEPLLKPLQLAPTENWDLLTGEVQSVLQTWEEVRRNTEENRERLAKSIQLQEYCSSYWALIAWTESTRCAILSTADPWKETEVQQIDGGIEQKLQEFDQLSAAGQRLREDGSYLEQTIKERTEELKEMLDWVQANWRTQRRQLSQKSLVVNTDAVKREQSQGNEMSQQSQNQASRGVQGSLEQSSIKMNFPCLEVQETSPVQACLSSGVCLILSLDEQSSCINQVCKQPSLSNSEEHTLLLPGSNKTKCLQLCNEPVISHSKEQKKHFQSNMQDQHSEVNHFIKSQHSQGTNPAHMQPSHTYSAQVQPSQDMMQQVDTQTLRQQTTGNIQIQRQKSPVKDESQWQQSPSNYLRSTTSNKEQRSEQKAGAETSSTHHARLPTSSTQIYQQLSDRMPLLGDSQTYLSEDHSTGNDQIGLASSQNFDRLQKSLFIGEGAKEMTYSKCGQTSSQLSLQLSDANHMKDQQLSCKKPSSIKQAPMPPQTAVPAEVTHRVSTYLHVTDISKLTDGPSEQRAAGCTMSSSSVSLLSSSSSLSQPPSSSSSLSHLVLCGGISSHGCVTPKAGSIGLEQPMRSSRRIIWRRHSTLSVIRHAHFALSPHSFRERSNTWPEGRQRPKLQLFMKKDLLSEEISSKPNKTICPYLFRASLPQDSRVLCNSASQELNLLKRDSSSASSELTESDNQPSLAVWPGGSDSRDQAKFEMQPVTDHNSLMQSDHKTVHMLDKVLFSPIYEKEDQQTDKTEQRPHAKGRMRSATEHSHWEVKGKHQDLKQHPSEPFAARDPTPMSCTLLCSSSPQKHECHSVHTRIKDLHTHVYRAPRHLQRNSQMSSVLLEMKDLSHPEDSAAGSRQRVVVCGESECAVCCPAREEEPMACTDSTHNSPKLPQLAHQQFLEDEEELEDIWKGKADGTALDWDKTGVSGPVAF